MKLSELIQKLQALKEIEGDLEVFTYNHNGFSKWHEYNLKVAYTRILSKRESRPDKWESYRSNCNEENKGEKVCQI